MYYYSSLITSKMETHLFYGALPKIWTYNYLPGDFAGLKRQPITGQTRWVSYTYMYVSNIVATFGVINSGVPKRSGKSHTIMTPPGSFNVNKRNWTANRDEIFNLEEKTRFKLKINEWYMLDLRNFCRENVSTTFKIKINSLAIVFFFTLIL